MPNVNGKKNTSKKSAMKKKPDNLTAARERGVKGFASKSSAPPRGKNVIPTILTSKAGLAAAKKRANRVTSVQAETGPNVSVSLPKRGKFSTYVTPSSYSTKTKKGRTTTTTTTDKKTGSVKSYKQTSMPKRKYPTTTVMGTRGAGEVSGRYRRGPGRG